LIEINLLPSGERRRASRSRTSTPSAPKLPAFQGDPWTAGLGVAAAVVLLASAFAYWQTGTRTARLSSEIEQAVSDSAQLSSTIALMDALKAKQDTVSQQIAVIRGVDERRYVWPHLMDEVSRAVPAYTWLTKLTGAESADTTGAGLPGFTLEGSVGSTQALTRLMKNLELSPFIRDVTLVTSEQTTEQGRTFQKFTLEAKYEMPDSSAVETVPVIPTTE
jgi:Tfp pilus assembly protein PilN